MQLHHTARVRSVQAHSTLLPAEICRWAYKTWHFIPTGKSFLRAWPTKPPDSSTATLRCAPLSLFLLMLFIWQPHYDPIFWGASDTDLMAYQMAWTPTPILFYNLTFEVAIKPLRTTSTGRTLRYHTGLLQLLGLADGLKTFYGPV